MANETFTMYLRFIKAKQQLIEIAEQYGINHPRVMACSRKVDALVVELQKRKAVG